MSWNLNVEEICFIKRVLVNEDSKLNCCTLHENDKEKLKKKKVMIFLTVKHFKTITKTHFLAVKKLQLFQNFPIFLRKEYFILLNI